MTPDFFARNQYRDYVIYRELAARETNADFRAVLDRLTAQERADFEFWRTLAKRKEFSVHPLTISFFVALRKVFGLTFTARFLEGREEKMIAAYETYLRSVRDPVHKKRVREIVNHEIAHERSFIDQIKEEKVEFISSIILGVNDGLIELTGALVGFSFAFLDRTMVGTTGLITGIAASLSMASSA